MNVVTCEFLHETNTFNTRPTTIQCFQDRFTFYGYDDCVAQVHKPTSQVSACLPTYLPTYLPASQI